ncbi:MAG: AbrB/MazE/SpoVT family DNA-binding domain-containing protein [Candidatus Brocadiae bacterium]|nr:AbrB/MazE/SpoVT family DNA-binding domain-containing protein [Candidatus Brocadiia bacterium]
MQTAKVFTNGGSQAVRLPKDCRFDATEVYVKKVDGMVILLSKEDPWASLVSSLDRFTDDFASERDQGRQPRRPSL